VKTLEYPFTEEKVRGLRAGERVAVSGRVFTGRDRLHKWLFEGRECPVDLRDGALYHCGPVVLQRGGQWVVRAAGPTTSIREEPYTPAVIERCGVRLIIGKGGMGDATRAACQRFGCVYLQAVGGAACVMASAVTRVEGVHLLNEFGSAEAMWELTVKDLVCAVTMDAAGRSLHHRVWTASRRALRSLIEGR
jgi:fumarate hydratase class I